MGSLSLRSSFLLMSEATSLKSHWHDCPNMSSKSWDINIIPRVTVETRKLNTDHCQSEVSRGPLERGISGKITLAGKMGNTHV